MLEVVLRLTMRIGRGIPCKASHILRLICRLPSLILGVVLQFAHLMEFGIQWEQPGGHSGLQVLLAVILLTILPFTLLSLLDLYLIHSRCQGQGLVLAFTI